MTEVNYVSIQVSTNGGESLLCETHLIGFGPEGMLGIPERLGYAAKDLLCFPTKEEKADLGNQGAPFSAICEALKHCSVSSFSNMLLSAGFVIAENLTGTLWVRCDPAKQISLKLPNISTTSHVLRTETCSSRGSRRHLNPMVRTRMKEVCNEVCPRDDDGLMLWERSAQGVKRPAWCISKIMHELEQEFDAADLEGVQDKAMSFMARNAQAYRRLLNMTDQDWLNLREAEKKRMIEVKDSVELSFENWKKGPYGYFWLIQGLRRQPSAEELDVFSKRKFEANCNLVPTTQ